MTSDVNDEREWALSYLLGEVAELGGKAARQAIAENSLEHFSDVGDRDAIQVLARDSWDFYYSTVVLDAVDALKPSRKQALPGQPELLELLFERAFLPALRQHLGVPGRE